MPKKSPVIFPKTQEILAVFGENLRLARLRRHIPASLAAERVGISRATLSLMEKGSPSVALGHYVQYMVTLGLEKDILKLADDDELGRKLQDVELSVRKRAPRRRNL
jgi:transcriptional regulator with XRE-family HTH domain